MEIIIKYSEKVKIRIFSTLIEQVNLFFFFIEYNEPIFDA